MSARRVIDAMGKSHALTLSAMLGERQYTPPPPPTLRERAWDWVCALGYVAGELIGLFFCILAAALPWFLIIFLAILAAHHVD